MRVMCLLDLVRRSFSIAWEMPCAVNGYPTALHVAWEVRQIDKDMVGEVYFVNAGAKYEGKEQINHSISVIV